MNQIKMGKFISELRKEKGFTQKDIGDKLNLTDNSISKWERGINAPDIYYLVPLAEILGVSINELLNGERNVLKKTIVKNNKTKVLEAVNVSKKIGRKRIINNINLTIYKEEIVGLIGPNGAGKSTFIKTILGLYKVTTGDVKISGFNIKDNFEKAMENIGCIIEKPDLYLNLTGFKNLQLVALMNNVNDNPFIEEVIEFMKLKTVINEKVKDYSLGMRQRLAIACALIKKPKLLVLDEPTNGLDPLGVKELRDIIKYLNKKYQISVLLSSHNLCEIENLCDRVVIIDNGYLIEDIYIQDIVNNKISLEEEYLYKTSGSKNQIGGEL